MWSKLGIVIVLLLSLLFTMWKETPFNEKIIYTLYLIKMDRKKEKKKNNFVLKEKVVKSEKSEFFRL